MEDGTTKTGSTGGGAGLGGKMTDELCFEQDEFQDIHKDISRNQSKYISLKFNVSRLEMQTWEYSAWVQCENYQRLKTETLESKLTFKSTPVIFHFPLYIFFPPFSPCSLPRKANLYGTHQQAFRLLAVFHQREPKQETRNRAKRAGSQGIYSPGSFLWFERW